MKRQRGTSLISLMVGLAMSMVTTLGLLFAYKGLVTNTKEVAASSQRSNQSAALAVALGRMIQQAGWGQGVTATPPGGAADTDLVLLAGAGVNQGHLAGTPLSLGIVPQTGNAVVWDTQVNGSQQCSALVVISGGLMLLGPVGCSNAASWADIDWSAGTPLAPSGSFGALSLSAARGSCWPYGGGPGVQSAVVLQVLGLSSSASSYCLSNIPN